MRHFPRPFTVAARLSLAVVWLVGLIGPGPAVPVFAGAAASQPAGFPPANDDFADAAVITLPPTYSDSQDLLQASSQTAEGEYYPCGEPDVPSVWYAFTPAASGFYEFDTSGSIITHTLAIYSGPSLGALTTLDCITGDSSGTGLSTMLSADATYYVQLSGAVTVAKAAAQPQGGATVVLSVYTGAEVSGTVWDDADGDGVQDAGEPGLAGATVVVLDEFFSVQSMVSTDADGRYAFTGLPDDTIMSLGFAPPPPGPWAGSPQNVGSDTTDSDADPFTGETAPFTLTSNEVLILDAGFGAPVEITGRAWRDLNSNNAQDVGEPGLPDVFICLNPVDFPCDLATYTDADGNYSFLVPAGDYSLDFDEITDFTHATADVGSDAIDSDAAVVDGVVPTFTVSLGDVVAFDAGYQTTGFGDRVWRDLNEDGVQDADEPGLAGVAVDLYDSSGFVISTTTDVNGDYGFLNLTPGDYAAVFNLPTGNSFSPQDAGADDALDSDADPGTGRTITLTLSAGQLDLSWDAGLTKPFFIVDNLNEYSDTTLGDGLCDDTTSVAAFPYGECSLRAAIEEANADPDFDVIQFDNTVFSVTQTIAQTSAYTVTTSQWVDAPGSTLVTLDAGDAARHFLVDAAFDADVRLTGLTLANGWADLDAWSGNGGSIYNESARLTLIDVVIDQAYAYGGGGGLFNGASAHLTNVTIANAEANYGGGLVNTHHLSATSLLLDSNTAYEGGGLYNDGLALLFTSNITGNVASGGDGGGVLNFGAFESHNSDIQHNTARWDGGGLANEAGKRLAQAATPADCGCGPSYNAVVTLTNTFVSYNLAGVLDDEPAYGGGIFNGAGTLLVDESQVFNNTVYGYGGGLFNEGAAGLFQTAAPPPGFECFDCPAVATIQQASALFSNLALSTTVVSGGDPVITDTYPSQGGGLFNAGLTIVDASSVSDNTANIGGGFFNEASALVCGCGPISSYVPTLFVRNGSTLTDNLAVLEGDPSFSEIFTGDGSGGLGGGGFNSGQAYFTATTVVGNVADLLGGGLFNGLFDLGGPASQTAAATPAAFGQADLPFLRLTASDVTGNAADPLGLYFGSGGGLFNFIGAVEIDGGSVSGNTASQWGGGIANGCIFCLISGAAGPAATPQGLGIFLFLLLANLYVHDGAQITNNATTYSGSSEQAGGGLFNSGFAMLEDSAVLSNTTGGVGGGAVNVTYLTLDHTAVEANSAVEAGGGLYNLGFFLTAQAQAAALNPAGPIPFAFFNFAPGLSLAAPLVIRNDSSLSNNRANPDYEVGFSGDGGGLLTASPALIDDSTIAGNWAAGDGGGIAVTFGTAGALAAGSSAACLQGLGGLFTALVYRVVLNNTLVSDNQAGAAITQDAPQGVGGGLYVAGDGPGCGVDLPLEANASPLAGNGATAGGGGIYVDGGEAYLHNSNLLNNNGDSDGDGDGNGGGSYNNFGYLLIDPANVTGNSAQFGGGGYYASGTTLITQTTFATNTAQVDGGALVITDTAEVIIGNTTFSGNGAARQGGAIAQHADGTELTLANTTLTNNSTGPTGQAVAGASAGAALFRLGIGNTSVQNTLIFGNGGVSPDCTFVDQVTNLTGLANMGDASCAFIPGWTTADPLLGPLQYNGGANSILTHALGSLSPAIDAADTGVCSASPVFGVDERNNLRLLDLACDIGAFEFESLTLIELVSFTATAQGAVVQLAWETAAEIDTAGFNLYRAAAPGGSYVQINALLIAAHGPKGGSYTAPDAPGAGTWYYRLEDVDTHGMGTLHGPAVVTVGGGANSTHVVFLPLIGNR